MIQTVTGQIRAEELGITMCHEHLALNLTRIRGDEDSDFSCTDMVIQEVKQMMEYGVRSVIEVTTIDMGRDVRQLVRIGKACGLNIVCATGFYLHPYHPAFLEKSKTDEICNLFCRDIKEGINDTGVKAGVIGEVATSLNRITEGEAKVLQAAAQASLRTGVAITTHCHMGTMALEQSLLLQREGMDPGRIVLGHLDLTDDKNYHLEVLQTGVNIGFDTIGKVAYLSDERRADNLIWLLERGYADRIILSQDVSRKSYFAVNQHFSGYMSVMREFIPLLKQRGVTEEALEWLLVKNPARIFNASLENKPALVP